MKIKTIFTVSLLALLLLSLTSLRFLPVQAQSATPISSLSGTPTYDPFIETPLPSNPTELELGQNLYWHWCMPCHGDQGQGLADEFRGKWESDHQNCWARGCHAGHEGDMGFPIPTVVPAIVGSAQLAQFSSLQSLAEYLHSTHPPQRPGILETNEYHAVAVYVFTINQRTLGEFPLTETPTPTSLTPTSSLPPSNQAGSPLGLLSAIGLAILLTVLVLFRQKREQP
jgi:mono/diheme cytochrome c family protein